MTNQQMLCSGAALALIWPPVTSIGAAIFSELVE
jgi:hypothetical protein